MLPDFICVKTDEVIKFGPPGFRRPPIQTTVTAGYENHPETPFPVDLVGEVFNYTIPSDKFSKNFATDSVAAQR